MGAASELERSRSGGSERYQHNAHRSAILEQGSLRSASCSDYLEQQPHLRLLLQLALWLFGVEGIAFMAHIGGFFAGLGLARMLHSRIPDARISYISFQIRSGNYKSS